MSSCSPRRTTTSPSVNTGVRSSPSYFFDGASDGGGGSADAAKSIFDSKIDPAIEKHLADYYIFEIDKNPVACVALHTWPELGAVTIDVYVCNFSADNSARAARLLAELETAFAPASVERQRLRRGELNESPS